MASNFNPFSGLGKIAAYVRWNRFRGKTYSQLRKLALSKFGNRFNNIINSKIAEEKLTESPATAFNRSGQNRSIEEIPLPFGKNKAKNIRVTGRVTNSKFKSFGGGISNERLFTFDVSRTGTKRQLRTTLREKILDAFFSHYEIANKYRPDFRRRFGDVDVLDIEGI